MKVEEVVLEFDEEENPREFPNPLKADVNAAGLWDLSDEITGRLRNQWAADNNVSLVDQRGRNFSNTLAKAIKGAREQYTDIIDIPIDKIITTETHLVKDHLTKLVNGGDIDSLNKPPTIYKSGDTLVVADGNHRVVAAHLQGKKTISARVFDFDKLKKQLNIKT